MTAFPPLIVPTRVRNRQPLACKQFEGWENIAFCGLSLEQALCFLDRIAAFTVGMEIAVGTRNATKSQVNTAQQLSSKICSMRMDSSCHLSGIEAYCWKHRKV